MIYKKPGTTPGKIRVTFEVPGTIWAERINLVGDFNDWDEENLPFIQNAKGNWELELELDEGQSYCFRYLFDGIEWCDEWDADGYTPNIHGSYDAIIKAELPPEK